ncbi:unnamed protein product [Calypogeia fissa]
MSTQPARRPTTSAWPLLFAWSLAPSSVPRWSLLSSHAAGRQTDRQAVEGVSDILPPSPVAQLHLGLSPPLASVSADLLSDLPSPPLRPFPSLPSLSVAKIGARETECDRKGEEVCGTSGGRQAGHRGRRSSATASPRGEGPRDGGRGEWEEEEDWTRIGGYAGEGSRRFEHGDVARGC